MERDLLEIPLGARAAAAAAVVAVFLLAVTAGRAEEGAAAGEPEWLSQLTTLPAGDAIEMTPCRLDFVLSWSRIVVAGRTEVTLGIAKDDRYPGKLIGTSEGGSRGGARLLWPYDHTFKSVMDPGTLQPVAFHSTEIDRKETLWTSNFYGGEGVRIKSVTLDKKDGDRKEKTREFPYPETHDLMSAFLYARSLSLGVGDEVLVLVHPFGSPYLVKFTMLGHEDHKTGLGEFEAMKVDLQIWEVEKDLSLTKYKKFKKATAWVSNDEHRLPLEVRADLFIGSIRVILKEREFLGEDGKALVLTEGERKREVKAGFSGR